MKTSKEWLAALVAAVPAETHTGIKILTNPADYPQAILATNKQIIGIGSPSRRTAIAAVRTFATSMLGAGWLRSIIAGIWTAVADPLPPVEVVKKRHSKFVLRLRPVRALASAANG